MRLVASVLDSATLENESFILFYFYLLIYFWLCWVLVAFLQGWQGGAIL